MGGENEDLKFTKIGQRSEGNWGRLLSSIE